MPIDYEKLHKAILEKKWVQLKKRGLTPPKDSEENKKRAEEAHGY